MLSISSQFLKVFPAVLAAALVWPLLALAQTGSVAISVDLDSTLHRMRGGIGASWHAIEDSIPVSGNTSHGGSGWGANPAPEDEAAWQAVYAHAGWLGLDFCRVELEQRMYEPEKGRFDWESREMRILYRILDWCEKNQADVFLQQMWSNADWIAYPEFRGDPVKRVHSAPVSLEDFAQGLAALAGHLIQDKGYTCIKWLCINNEPGYDWSWWQMPPNETAPFTPALELVRETLDRKGISLPLSGPDWTDTPALTPEKLDFDRYLGAYDIHSYYSRYDWMKRDENRPDLPLSLVEQRLGDWAGWAHQRNKPFFLSEVGSMIFGWHADNNGPNTFPAALKDAELVLRGLNQRVDGFNKWSFINRGDLDGQWQLINTWDIKGGKLLEKYSPKPNSYFVYGLVSRFTVKYSRVPVTTVKGGALEGLTRVFAAALESPGGELTLLVVNDADSAFPAGLSLNGLKKETTLYKYQVTSEQKDNPGLIIEPLNGINLNPELNAFSDELPASSLTIYTTYRLEHRDWGVIAE